MQFRANNDQAGNQADHDHRLGGGQQQWPVARRSEHFSKRNGRIDFTTTTTLAISPGIVMVGDPAKDGRDCNDIVGQRRVGQTSHFLQRNHGAGQFSDEQRDRFDQRESSTLR